MNRCKECKWWDKDQDIVLRKQAEPRIRELLGYPELRDALGYGRCMKPHLTGDREWNLSVNVGCDGCIRGELWTDASFGCVQWEAKDERARLPWIEAKNG